MDRLVSAEAAIVSVVIVIVSFVFNYGKRGKRLLGGVPLDRDEDH